MRLLRTALATGVLASVVAFPSAAHAAKGSKKGAAPPSSSPAQALLAEGRKLMAQGNYGEACPKIAESQSQAPSPTTAIMLGGCYKKAGKLASAWASYRAAADNASHSGKKKIAASAQHLADALEPQLSRLTIKVQDASGVEVRCDGEAVPESDVGNPVPRDGGAHDIEASATGKQTWKKHVELAESGQTLEVDVPRLQDDAATASSTPSEGAEKTSAPPEATSEGPSHGLGGQKIAGIAVAGAGVAAIALGAFAGIHANSTYNSALAACGGTTNCAGDPNGLSLRDTASTWATVSTVSFVVAGAALAGGAVLFFTAPRQQETQPEAPAVGVAPASRGTGLSLVGRF